MLFIVYEMLFIVIMNYDTYRKSIVEQSIYTFIIQLTHIIYT